jgi:signal transduction histidine kinase
MLGRYGLGVRRSAVLGAVVALSAALLVGAIVLRVELRRGLEDQIGRQTLTLAEGVASVAKTGDLSTVIDRSRTPSWVQVINEKGAVVASTRNISALKQPFAPLPATRQSMIRTMSGLVLDPSDRLAVASVPIEVGGERFVVLAASPLDLADATDRSVVSVLAIVFPILLAAAALVVWAVVRRSLRPVEAIRAQVAAISSTDLVRRVPVPNTDDEIAHLASTMNDMLDRLAEATARQRRFVADASHELRSPLASLRAQLEASTIDPDTDARWRATVKNMSIDHDRLERLVNDLLLLARHNEGRPLEREPLDLGPLVRTEIGRRDLRDGLQMVTSVENVIVDGNTDALVRVLRNLLDNAERHATTTIEVEVKRVAGFAVLRVADDGRGIPADQHLSVFERFHRLDDARSSDAGGSGLGLAIVADLVRDHEGVVGIEPSETGARVVVRIPVVDISVVDTPGIDIPVIDIPVIDIPVIDTVA